MYLATPHLEENAQTLYNNWAFTYSHYVTFQLLNGNWQRKDVNCTAKAYSRTEVQSVLEKVGFTKVLVNDVTNDAEISGLADSRIVYVFRKN